MVQGREEDPLCPEEDVTRPTLVSGLQAVTRRIDLVVPHTHTLLSILSPLCGRGVGSSATLLTRPQSGQARPQPPLLFFSVDNTSVAHTIFFCCASLLLGYGGVLLPAWFPNGTAACQWVYRPRVPK